MLAAEMAQAHVGELPLCAVFVHPKQPRFSGSFSTFTPLDLLLIVVAVGRKLLWWLHLRKPGPTRAVAFYSDRIVLMSQASGAAAESEELDSDRIYVGAYSLRIAGHEWEFEPETRAELLSSLQSSIWRPKLVVMG